jgi:hypothetical protein
MSLFERLAIKSNAMENQSSWYKIIGNVLRSLKVCSNQAIRSGTCIDFMQRSTSFINLLFPDTRPNFLKRQVNLLINAKKLYS